MPTGGGDGVDEEDDAFFLGDLADFLDRFNRADVVIDEVDANENGLVRDGGANVLGIDLADGVDGDLGGGEAVMFFEILNRIHHGGMFRRAPDDVGALARVRVGKAFNGEIGRFRSARGENNVVRAFGIDERGDLFARFLHTVTHAQTEAVQARWAAVRFHEVGLHGFKGFRKEGGRGLVIEVDGFHSDDSKKEKIETKLTEFVTQFTTALKISRSLILF